MGFFDRWPGRLRPPEPRPERSSWRLDEGPPWRPSDGPTEEDKRLAESLREPETLDFRPNRAVRLTGEKEARLRQSRLEGEVASRPVVRGGLPAGWPAKEYPWCTDPKEGPR